MPRARVSAVFFTVALLLGCESPVASGRSRVASDPTRSGQHGVSGHLPPVCQKAFSKKNICGALTWENAPSTREDLEATLRLYTLQGEVLDTIKKESLRIVPFMAAHGHGSHKKVEIADIADGEFTLTRIVLSMPGEWQIKVQIVDDQGNVTDEAVWLVIV